MKDRDLAWSDLHHDHQQNLEKFLNIELDLAGTLCDIAETHDSPERRADLQTKIQTALDTVRRLAEWIQDSSTRKRMLDGAEELDSRLRKLGQKIRPATRNSK